MKGVRLKTRADPAAAALHAWLERLRAGHADRIIPIDDAVALAWGRLAAVRPQDMADALMAATASVHRMILVTRNVADFKDLDVPVLDPWKLG